MESICNECAKECSKDQRVKVCDEFVEQNLVVQYVNTLIQTEKQKLENNKDNTDEKIIINYNLHYLHNIKKFLELDDKNKKVVIIMTREGIKD